MYRGRIGWVNISKVITKVIAWSLQSYRSPNIDNLVQGEHLKYLGGIGVGRCSQQKTCNISETGQDIGPRLLLDD